MANTISNIAASLIVVLLVTTLVLPGRQTPAVFKAGGQAVSSIFSSALGK